MTAEEKDLGLGIFLPAITEHKTYFKIQILFLRKCKSFDIQFFFSCYRIDHEEMDHQLLE